MSELPDVYCDPVPEEEGLGVVCVDTPEGSDHLPRWHADQ